MLRLFEGQTIFPTLTIFISRALDIAARGILFNALSYDAVLDQTDNVQMYYVLSHSCGLNNLDSLLVQNLPC